VGCWDGGTGFIVLDFDTTAADPTLTARVLDGGAVERVRFDTTLSALSP
jgi:hypothetical protein